MTASKSQVKSSIVFFLAELFFAGLCFFRFYDVENVSLSAKMLVFIAILLAVFVTILSHISPLENQKRMYFFLSAWTAIVFPALFAGGILNGLQHHLSLAKFLVSVLFLLPIFLAGIPVFKKIYWYTPRQNRALTYSFAAVFAIAFLLWMILGDFSRCVFYALFIPLSAIVIGLLKPETAVSQVLRAYDERFEHRIVPLAVLLYVFLFVVFFLYGEPTLIEETLIDY